MRFLSIIPLFVALNYYSAEARLSPPAHCTTYDEAIWMAVFADLEPTESTSVTDHNIQWLSQLEPELQTDIYAFKKWLRQKSERHGTAELSFLISLKLGSRETTEKARLQEQLQSRMEPIQQKLAATKASCPKDSEKESLTAWPVETFSLPAATVGARLTFMTAHQSCDSLQRPSMTTNSAPPLGITVVGDHPDGVGSRRRITNLALLNETHHYLKGRTRPSSQCFDVHAKPLIYDYGGKPRASLSADSDLNLFRNAGTGSSELGIDCSGFVFTALASQGLKLKSSSPLRAADVFGVSARMMSQPQYNGLNCLKQRTLTRTSHLKKGDLIAGTGHIAMVDSASDDPFGVGWIGKLSDCKASNIRTERFDFDVMQSSADKNGIGINLMQAFEFLESHPKIKGAMIETAVWACRAQFGKTHVASHQEGAIVYHKGGRACSAPPIGLTRSRCVQSCSYNR